MFETTTRPEPAATTGDARPVDRRVLVLAPFGRDAAEIGRVLGVAGFDVQRCAGADELCAEIRRGAAAGVLAEEALSDDARGRIASVLAEQPAWSDFPLLVMTSRDRTGHGGWGGLRGIEGTAHLTLLERPLHTAVLVSAVRTAVESRRRQYQVRDELAAREAAEQALQQALAKAEEGDRLLAALMEQVPEGITIADAPDVRIRWVSHMGRQLTGQPRDVIEGIPVGEHAAKWGIFCADGVTPARDDDLPLTRAVQRGEIITDEEWVLRSADGRQVNILCNAAPIRDADGQIVSGVIVWRDVTERKCAEEALHKLNATLEQQVAERTAVAERRARDLGRLAAELSEAEHRERKRLARLLHADLQQLLLAVKLRLSLLVGGDPKKLAEHVERLDELIGECLRTSRTLTRELAPPILQHGSLSEVVAWLGTWFGEKHGLTVDVDAPDELPPTPEHVRVFLFQAVRELLTNVMKHSGSMEARVALAAHGAHLTVQVEDGGNGFDPRAVEQCFQRPEGFGLFNIRERLEALLGRLEIESTPQGGACLRLVLPIAEGAESPLDNAERQGVRMIASHVGKSRFEDGVVRILVADDHAVVRDGLVGLLDVQPDLEVVGEAADGEQAVQQAEALRPDAIIMDVDMPNADGVEATRRIKARQPEILIIGLSLHDETTVARSMTEAGADAYVSKHAPAKDLVEAVRRTCERDWEE